MSSLDLEKAVTMLSVVRVSYFCCITRHFSKCFHFYKNYCQRYCFACVREISVDYNPFLLAYMVFQKELDCMEEYWWVQSDFGNVTYNV